MNSLECIDLAWAETPDLNLNMSLANTMQTRLDQQSVFLLGVTPSWLPTCDVTDMTLHVAAWHQPNLIYAHCIYTVQKLLLQKPSRKFQISQFFIGEITN